MRETLGGDQCTEQQQRGELGEFGEQIPERLEGLGGDVIQRRQRRPRGEGGQIRIGMRQMTCRVHHDRDRHRAQRLQPRLSGEDLAAPGQRDGGRDTDADGQTEHEFEQHSAQMRTLVLGHRQEDEDERQREAVIETRFDVEQPAQAHRDVGAAHQRRGEHRIGGGQNRSEQQCRRPVEVGQVVRRDRDTDHRQWHPQAQSTAGQPPAFAQGRDAGPLAVGEQHREQGDVGEHRDDLVLGALGDHPQSTGAQQRAGQQEQQSGGQHRACRDSGQRHADEQHDSVRQH